jgi:hypothetical protein
VSAWDSVWQRVPLGCWNWFDTRNGRAQQEAASIVAALVALHFPQRFAAMVTHSGVEPTLAHSAASAVSSMRESQRVQPQLPTRTVPQDLPALLVIQGSADPIVLRANGMRAAQAWAARTHALPGPARLLRRGKRYPQTPRGRTHHAWRGPLPCGSLNIG